MIRSNSSDAPNYPSGGPIYHEISPRLTLVTRVVGACAVLMVMLAFIFCLAKGTEVNKTFYLLACNVVITTFIGGVNVWWYRKGDLEADKYWYMLVVAGVIMFQCLAIDIFVFNVKPLAPTVPPITTMHPNTTHHNATHHKFMQDMVTAAVW